MHVEAQTPAEQAVVQGACHSIHCRVVSRFQCWKNTWWKKELGWKKQFSQKEQEHIRIRKWLNSQRHIIHDLFVARACARTWWVQSGKKHAKKFYEIWIINFQAPQFFWLLRAEVGVLASFFYNCSRCSKLLYLGLKGVYWCPFGYPVTALGGVMNFVSRTLYHRACQWANGRKSEERRPKQPWWPVY